MIYFSRSRDRHHSSNSRAFRPGHKSGYLSMSIYIYVVSGVVVCVRWGKWIWLEHCLANRVLARAQHGVYDVKNMLFGYLYIVPRRLWTPLSVCSLFYWVWIWVSLVWCDRLHKRASSKERYRWSDEFSGKLYDLLFWIVKSFCN